MTASIPPPPVTGRSAKSFYHQAATASVWLLLFPFVVQFISITALAGLSPEDRGLPRLFFAAVIGLAMLSGVVLGIIALFGISKYGTKGILVKSLFGILVPLILVALSIPVFLHAREMALRIHAEQAARANPPQ